MERETIIRSEAAEILDCAVSQVWQYIHKGKLQRAPKGADGKERVYLDEVLALKEKRIQRKQNATEKKQRQMAKEKESAKKKTYNCGVYTPFDVMAVLDPDDDSGLAHVWFISRNAFDMLMTGLPWDRIPAKEIYKEAICGELPRAKYHD